MKSVDPATGRVIATYAVATPDQVEAQLQRTHQAWARWSASDLEDRADVLRSAASILRARSQELASLMTREMGKPISEGVGEAKKCAWVCDYYADHGAAFLADESVATDASTSYVAYRPLGVVLAVMPWNFPFWQVFRFAAPALMAGNAGLLKHASNVPGCSLAIADIWREAGLPDDVFASLLIGSAKVAELIRDRRIAAVTLTGSTPAGRAVAAAAGAALKPCVLELGGSDPYVILADADIAHAAAAGATSRLINSGQSCIAAKRFIAVDAIHDEFVDALVSAMHGFPLGDPNRESTRIGPQARVDLRDELHDQVLRSIAAGAKVILGCAKPDGPGAYYPASVLTDVEPGMPAYDDELFGPVAAVIRARDEEDAIRMANDTSFGLGAAVFTADTARGECIARDRLDAGACFVNDFVRSDPRLPFGGIKESGFGRELSRHGMLEFVNTKTVYVR